MATPTSDKEPTGSTSTQSSGDEAPSVATSSPFDPQGEFMRYIADHAYESVYLRGPIVAKLLAQHHVCEEAPPSKSLIEVLW